MLVLLSIGAALAATGTITVDDADPTAFVLTGSASEATEGGYAEHFWYRAAAAAPTTTARWTPPVTETGLYTVQSYVPYSPFATATLAPITIHAHGEVATAPFDQSISGGDFHEVYGGRAFKLVAGGGAHVEMTDASGEDPSLFVGFDAFRFTRVGDAGTIAVGELDPDPGDDLWIGLPGSPPGAAWLISGP